MVWFVFSGHRNRLKKITLFVKKLSGNFPMHLFADILTELLIILHLSKRFINVVK